MNHPNSYPGYSVAPVMYPPGQFAYAPPPRQPDNATAICAAVFALILGLYSAWGSYSALTLLSKFSGSLRTLVPYWMLLQIPAAFLLLLGGFLLLCRLTIGRVMVIAGSALVLTELFAMIAERAVRGQSLHLDTIAFTAMFIVPALVPMILAALPSTGRWIRARR
ncbi:hypothetical protein [Nocardia inohanensis]|uniref:hypothetical protein n=1 Tax=Nocardia inohanensis TaxID=209246 RepID=UPI000AB89E68|nr:hypothetical protein [Nocardia inohanensis]